MSYLPAPSRVRRTCGSSSVMASITGANLTRDCAAASIYMRLICSWGGLLGAPATAMSSTVNSSVHGLKPTRPMVTARPSCSVPMRSAWLLSSGGKASQPNTQSPRTTATPHNTRRSQTWRRIRSSFMGFILNPDAGMRPSCPSPWRNKACGKRPALSQGHRGTGSARPLVSPAARGLRLAAPSLPAQTWMGRRASRLWRRHRERHEVRDLGVSEIKPGRQDKPYRRAGRLN
jgi:hypothetical protein